MRRSRLWGFPHLIPDGVTQWPKCLAARSKGRCNCCWDTRSSQARTSEEKRKINLLVSNAYFVAMNHMHTICPCAVFECMYLCVTRVLAFSISLRACAQGVSVHMLLSWVCAVVYEAMAVCTVNTRFFLWLQWIDGYVQSVWLGGHKNICKEFW